MIITIWQNLVTILILRWPIIIAGFFAVYYRYDLIQAVDFVRVHISAFEEMRNYIRLMGHEAIIWVRPVRFCFVMTNSLITNEGAINASIEHNFVDLPHK